MVATTSPFVLNPGNRAYLSGASPRIARGGLGLFGLIFVTPFLIVGMFVIALALSEWYTWYRLTYAGADTQGVVVSRRVEKDSEDADDFYVVYRFEAGPRGDTRTYTAEETVSRAAYQQLREGARVPVRYAASDPRVSRIDGNTGGDARLFLSFFALFWNSVTIFFLMATVVPMWQEWEFQRRGQLLQGEVLSADSYEDSDGDLMVTLAYRFFSPEGREIHGKMRQMCNSLKGTPLPTPGTPVAVIYADEHTHRVL